MLYWLGGLIALIAGIYIGLGFPGLPGARDRVLPGAMRRRRRDHFTPLDLLRKRQRPSERR